MLRPRIALIAIAAIALSGCATFDNTDVVASVGDVELSADELERRAEHFDDVAQSQGASQLEDGRISGALARRTIASWIDLQLITQADIVDAWLRGPNESGLGCIFFVFAPDVVTSDAWIDQLEAGDDWDTIVEQSPFPVDANGRIPCFPTSELEPFVLDQLAGMSADDPYRTVTFADSTGGLARMQSLEELDGSELLDLANFVEPSSIEAIAAEIADTEIVVSSIYGRFDPVRRSVDPIG